MRNSIAIGPGIHDGDPGSVDTSQRPQRDAVKEAVSQNSSAILIEVPAFMREIENALNRIADHIGSGRPYEPFAPAFGSKYYILQYYRFRTIRFSNEFSGPLRLLRDRVMIGAEANYFFQGLLAQQMGLSWNTFRNYLDAWKAVNIIRTGGQYSMPTNKEIWMAIIGYDYGRYYQRKEERGCRTF